MKTLLLNNNEYTGIPAPKYLKDDPWFGKAPLSDENSKYIEKEKEIKNQEELSSPKREPGNIHQKLYEIATKNKSTTLHLHPPSIGGSENFQGGSENYHDR